MVFIAKIRVVAARMEQVFKGIPVVPSLGQSIPRSMDTHPLYPSLTSLTRSGNNDIWYASPEYSGTLITL